MKDIEFYKTPDGSVMMKPTGEPVRLLDMGCRAEVTDLLGMIRDRYPKTFDALSEIYTKNERNRMLYEFNICSRFIRCNCGEYDTQTMDIDPDGFFHFEQVGCPLRGNECRWEGVICNPRIDTKLTARELEIVELIAQGLQAQEIADRLCIAVTTVNRHRENIKARLGVRTVAQMVSYWHEHIKNT